jgi:WD40 repeat protein
MTFGGDLGSPVQRATGPASGPIHLSEPASEWLGLQMARLASGPLWRFLLLLVVPLLGGWMVKAFVATRQDVIEPRRADVAISALRFANDGALLMARSDGKVYRMPSDEVLSSLGFRSSQNEGQMESFRSKLPPRMAFVDFGSVAGQSSEGAPQLSGIIAGASPDGTRRDTFFSPLPTLDWDFRYQFYDGSSVSKTEAEVPFLATSFVGSMFFIVQESRAGSLMIQVSTVGPRAGLIDDNGFVWTPDQPVVSAAFSANPAGEGVLYAGQADGWIDILTTRLINEGASTAFDIADRLNTPTSDAITNLAASSPEADHRFVSGDARGRLFAWQRVQEADTPSPVALVLPPSRLIAPGALVPGSLRLSADAGTMLVRTADGRVMVGRGLAVAPPVPAELPVLRFIALRDGKQGRTIEDDTPRAALVRPGGEDVAINATAAELTPDGRTILIGQSDGTISRVALPDLETFPDEALDVPMTMIKGHADVISHLALSRDGTLLASASIDGRLMLTRLDGHAALAAWPSFNLEIGRRPAPMTVLPAIGLAEAPVSIDELRGGDIYIAGFRISGNPLSVTLPSFDVDAEISHVVRVLANSEIWEVGLFRDPAEAARRGAQLRRADFERNPGSPSTISHTEKDQRFRDLCPDFRIETDQSDGERFLFCGRPASLR